MQERWNILVLAADKDHDKTGENGKEFSRVVDDWSQDGLQLFLLVAKEPSMAVHEAKVEASGHLSFLRGFPR